MIEEGGGKKTKQIINCHRVSFVLPCSFCNLPSYFVFLGACLCVPLRAQLSRV